MRLRIAGWVAGVVVAVGLATTVFSLPGSAAASAPATKRPATLTTRATTTAGTPDSTLPPIRHVFIIVLENESASATFPASGTAPAPYLAPTMVSEGAFLPNYYGVGHNSNDNYIAMISGQAPNLDNSEDCVLYGNFDSSATTGAPYDQQEGTGCIYPTGIQNIATQLDSAGLSWRDYNEDMGNDPSREASECGHPAVNSIDHTQDEEDGDAYATRHNPFVYFHNIIDDTTLCDTHVVNLDQLSTDLKSSSTTPNYVFITPNLCHDGHDATCDTPGENGGFAGINDFLSQYVPMITNSPAFKQQDGLLITTFDEASTSDTSDCCGEIPGPGEAEPGLNGAGGGRVGAVLLSPCIAPGTVSDVAYNHYSMLGSVENIFGLPHLGYAQLPGESFFGSDVFTGNCNSPPVASLAAPVDTPDKGSTVKIALSFGSSQTAATYALQVRQLHGRTATAWRTLETGASTGHYSFSGHAGATYEFRLRATNSAGLSSAFETRTIVIPTDAKAAGAHLIGHWRYEAVPGAWRGHADVGSAGASYSYDYTGGALALLATRLPAGGRVRVSFNGVSRVISVHAAVRRTRRIVFSARAKEGRHRLKLTVLSGKLAVEGLIVSNLS